jgi:hypothetical protein
MAGRVDTSGIERLAHEFDNGTGSSGRAGVLAEAERYGRNPFGWIALTPGGRCSAPAPRGAGRGRGTESVIVAMQGTRYPYSSIGSRALWRAS